MPADANSTIATLPHVEIYTNGGCEPNPGPGGYGVVLLHPKKRAEVSGGFRLTTNNRMEIFAAIAGNDDNRSLLLGAGGQVAVDEATVVRQVMGKQRAQTFNVIAPVAVQLAGDAEGNAHPRQQGRLNWREFSADPPGLGILLNHLSGALPRAILFRAFSTWGQRLSSPHIQLQNDS